MPVQSFKVTESDGRLKIEMTGDGLLVQRDTQAIPNIKIWHALSGVMADAANNSALVHRLTEAFNNGHASMSAAKNGSGLVFSFNEGSLSEPTMQVLRKLGQDEASTVIRINEAVAETESNIAEFRKRFPNGTGYRAHGGR